MARSGRPIRKEPNVLKSHGTGIAGRLRMASQAHAGCQTFSSHKVLTDAHESASGSAPCSTSHSFFSVQNSYGVLLWH